MLANQRHLFDIPDDVAYINCGYMSPLMKRVVDAGHEGLSNKARPWTISSEDFFTGPDALREAFAELCGATAEDIAIVAAAGYGVSLAAYNLPLVASQHILVLEDQFPSHVYPWREKAKEVGAKVVTLERPADGDWTALVLSAITGETGVVAVPNVHWIDGAWLDLVRIGERCRELGAALVVDATQSLGAAPLNVAAIQPDFLVSATYKWLMGPYSLGLLYVSPRWKEQGRPFEHNWVHRKGAQNFARLVDYQDAFEPGARRFDVGERSNFALVPAAEAGIRQLLEWGIAEIAATIEALSDEIIAGVEPIGLKALPRELRAGHYLGLKSSRALPEDLPQQLAAKKVYVSVRGDAVRVTPHVYNTREDVARFVEALTNILGTA